MNPYQYFIHRSIEFARTMGVPDARRYLAGLLDVLGDRNEADDLRQALIHLDESDKRLEAMQTNQPNLL